MASGNHASPAGFNISGKPATVAECPHEPEPRGPSIVLAGLCVVCGRATVHRDETGLPRHQATEEAA
jgi:hypothetical protein